jgi:hypothetical protein
MSEQLYWHFLRDDKRLRYRDGREVADGEIVEVGKTYEAVGPLELCLNGMHASQRAIDALDYAPGAVVCRVALDGEITDGTDKLVARRRTVLWMLDATTILHEFGCWCAERALTNERSQGREPDPHSWAAVEAKRKWLRGEITDQELAAAWAAAWAAVESAARAAAWSAAESAARDAARGAAWAAAWDAAESAARDAARSAARSAAERAAWAAAWDAARGTARNAAWGAARGEQNAELERLLFTSREAQR